MSINMNVCITDSKHNHCINCFTVMDCDYSRHCPISMCPNECRFRMHECKIDDHVANICPNGKIPCPSFLYGCPLRILRRNLADHLQVCPASIVHCTVERNRRLIDKDAARKIKDPEQGAPIMDNLDCSALDLCLALDDQIVINDSYRISKDILRRRTSSLSKYHPVLPLSVVEEHCTKFAYKTANLRNTITFSSEEDSSDEDDEVAMKTPAVSSECVRCRLDPGSQHLHVVGSIPSESSQKPITRKRSVEKTVYTNPGHNLLVDVCLDFLSASYAKRRDHYTISCDFVVKRGEYADHYQNYHADFVCNLNDWMIVRCPMNARGCQFYHRRFRPKIPENSSILYSNANFFIHVDDDTLSSMVGENPATNLLDWSIELPADLWIQICKLLSSQSLNALSKVCSKLRNVCKLVLPYKGMVQMKWQRTDDGKWIRKGKSWSFSRHFENIDQWVFDDMGPYCSHVKQCQFYDPITYSEPIPVFRTMTYSDLIK